LLKNICNINKSLFFHPAFTSRIFHLAKIHIAKAISRFLCEICNLRKFNSTSALICMNIFILSLLNSFCHTIHTAFDKVCKCRKCMIQRAGCISHVYHCSCTCVARKFAINKADRIVSNVDGLQSHSYMHSSIVGFASTCVFISIERAEGPNWFWSAKVDFTQMVK